MAKLLDKDGCKNSNCSAWESDCQRAVVYRVGKKLKISMVTDRDNSSPCELFLPRRFKDVREKLPE